MMGGTLLIGAALLTGLTATVLLFGNYLRREERYLDAVTPLIGVTAGLLSLALAYLTFQFVTTDYANAYVWNNTANYISLFYRITGVYAGNQGSILLWASLTAIVAFWAVVVRGLERRETKLVEGITMGVVTYFAAMLVLDSPFKPISAEFPEMDPGFVPIDGTGLNPLLIDPYMAIHPPIMFVAYALLTMPFAIAVAHFISTVRGEGGLFEAWIGSVTRWLRIAWLFLTAAIVLGSLWSYRVLGWGGIWAWDPVEVAVLIPWLFLTATLHAVMNYRSRSTYATLAPAMTGATLALIVYATAIVRSGVFRSVHSFADGGIGAALLVLLTITSILGIGLPLGYWLLREPETESESSSASQRWITRVNLKHLAVLSIGLLGFVSVWGLTFPVLNTYVTGVEVEVGGQYYNLWSYPIVLGVLLVLGFYMDYDVEGRRRALLSLGIFSLLTVLAALVVPSETWTLSNVDGSDALLYRLVGNASALSILPPAAYVCLTVIKRTLELVPGNPNRNFQLKQVGITMIHVAFALLVVTVTFSYLFTAQSSLVVADADREATIEGSAVHEVPDSNYAVQVSDYRSYQRPEDPNVEDMALSSGQIASRGQELHETRRPVYGTATQINAGPDATVIQLDNSGVWIGVMNASQTELGIAEGDQVVGVGTVMWDFLPELPQSDGVVVTDAASVGPVSNPPAALDQTRVDGTAVGLNVYQNGEQIAHGTAGQEQYLQQDGMEVRDVLVDRGLAHDTYVIAAVDDGTVSLTVKQIPLMTVMRLSVGVLLLGMLLVIVFDPAHGLARLWPRVTRQQNATETTSD
ncbi:cytochrome c biogenesis protein CcsA [Haloarchaeobius amylolyticus]|uniref:Cytochrome c biogenesis protein CcsA n=1 Tax=Haloarchaeobius amylolyticus TaxID=1198296 RepID=A0ABD6BMG0_9EURY